VQLASGAQGDVARKLVERRADLGLLFHHEASRKRWSAAPGQRGDGHGVRRGHPWRSRPTPIDASWRGIASC
jgi:hypothetical protein